jgi:hypothetical protein
MNDIIKEAPAFDAGLLGEDLIGEAGIFPFCFLLWDKGRRFKNKIAIPRKGIGIILRYFSYFIIKPPSLLFGLGLKSHFVISNLPHFYPIFASAEDLSG